MNKIIFKVSSNSNCSVPSCVQNWPILEKRLTHSAHSKITEGNKHLSQVNFHIWSLPKTQSLHKDIMFLAAQKLVGVQRKLNPVFEISLQQAAGLDENNPANFEPRLMSAEPDFGHLSCIWVYLQTEHVPPAWDNHHGSSWNPNDISLSTASSHCENQPEPGMFQRVCEFPIKGNKAQSTDKRWLFLSKAFPLCLAWHTGWEQIHQNCNLEWSK